MHTNTVSWIDDEVAALKEATSTPPSTFYRLAPHGRLGDRPGACSTSAPTTIWAWPTIPGYAAAAKEAIDRYGIGPSGAHHRLDAMALHVQLEEELAAFKGRSLHHLPEWLHGNVATIPAGWPRRHHLF
ncbi:MAG: hypothetical protein R3A10_05715 [Caldilineaceae bacterium]